MKDTIEELTRSVRQRLDSPLLGSFVVAWAIWNYQFLVVLFSAMSPVQTFRMIEATVFPTAWAFAWKAVFGPLVTTLIYVFVYPFPARFVHDYSLRRARELKESAMQIEGETLLSVAESRELRKTIVRIHEDYASDIEKRDREIERLSRERHVLPPAVNEKTEMEAVEAEPAVAAGKAEPASDESNQIASGVQRSPTSSQVELLVRISEFESVAPSNLIFKGAKDSRTKTAFDLEELESIGLIRSRYDQDYDDGVYYLTQDGRRLLVERELA